MKNGYAKLSVQEYNELIIENITKSRQLTKQEFKIKELQLELQEKSKAVDNLARAMKHTAEFLEGVSPKIENEWRAYIKAVKEAEK